MNNSATLNIQALNIVFFGTANFAAYHLYMLMSCSIHKIVAVFTQEKQCFYQKSSWSIFKIAKMYKLHVFLSHNLLISDILHILEMLKIDMIIVVSYGLILPQKILIIPKLGCINVHGSLLPRWRGAAPIQRAIEHGDSLTGISIIQMNSGIDTGNILYTKSCQISSTDTSHTLSKKLAQIGAIGLLKTIHKITLGTYYTIPQNSLYTTYASKIKKEEARINWKLPAIILERRIRAFNPWPISYFYTHQKRIKIWDAKIDHQNIKNDILSTLPPGLVLTTNTSGIYVVTGVGILILTILQISGKKKLPVKDILNAYYKWFIPNSILE